MWVDCQGPLHQHSSINPLIYCQVEEDLWCEESDDHPRNLEEKPTGGSVTSGGYVEVQSAPYAYDNGGEADGEDSKRSPLLGLSNPQIRRIARSGSIGCRVLHLFYGSRQTVSSAKGNGADFCEEPGGASHGYDYCAPFICERIVCITFSVCGGAIRAVHVSSHFKLSEFGILMRALSALVGADCSGNRIFTWSCLGYIRCVPTCV